MHFWQKQLNFLFGLTIYLVYFIFSDTTINKNKNVWKIIDCVYIDFNISVLSLFPVFEHSQFGIRMHI